MRSFTPALALALTVIASPATLAQPACIPARIAALPLVSFERPVVQATINGAPVIMMVDTGSEITFVTPETAARLHLKRNPDRRTTTITLGGTDIVENVVADKLSFGAQTYSELNLPVVPLRGAERSPDGLIGADLLHDFDVEIDLPHRLLTLYRGDSCKGAPPPWAAPFDILPVKISERLQLLLPAKINGRPVTALFDTGAVHEAIARDAATRLGVTATELQGDIAHKTIGPRSYAFRRHRFDTLVLGPETFHDAWFDVIDFHQPGVDVLIGVDYMLKRRFFLSYASGTMFMQRQALPP